MAEEDTFVGLSQFNRERSADGEGESTSGMKYGCIVGFLHANHSMEDIMAASSWKSANTFTLFYLKDLQLICNQMYHLGSVVAVLQLC